MCGRPSTSTLDAMTTSTAVPPEGGATAPSTSPRLLRRSRTDRLGAGVAGGLGEYFGIDPVLFRVLFATAAFFGGAGVLAYLLAWAAIPDAGTERAAVDGWVSELRRRRVPFWVATVAAAVIFWVIAFSWWAPGPFLPVVAVVALVIVAVSRSGHRAAPPAATVSLTKEPAAPHAATAPPWLRETRDWVSESRAARRERRARALPVLITTLLAAAVAITGLAIADAVRGIRLPVYFWVGGGIVLAGLLVGVALRRAPWSLTLVLLPALAGIIAFGNTGASLHDGVGQREYAPTSASALAGDYRLALGQTVLDLRHLGTLDTPRTVNVTSAAGQVRILLPRGMNATVHANVRLGEVTVNGTAVAGAGFGARVHHDGGYDIAHDVLPPANATGAPLVVNVHLADGNITVEQP
jgi:phage shock protein PspC (stress-responsive transcriptional regulator)